MHSVDSPSILTFCYVVALVEKDNPLNLSILISGGKETKRDSLSNCE